MLSLIQGKIIILDLFATKTNLNFMSNAYTALLQNAMRLVILCEIVKPLSLVQIVDLCIL